MKKQMLRHNFVKDVSKLGPFSNEPNAYGSNVLGSPATYNTIIGGYGSVINTTNYSSWIGGGNNSIPNPYSNFTEVRSSGNMSRQLMAGDLNGYKELLKRELVRDMAEQLLERNLVDFWENYDNPTDSVHLHGRIRVVESPRIT